MCISYSSVTVIEYSGKKQLEEQKVYFPLWRDRVHSGRKGRPAGAEGILAVRKQRDHILFIYRKERDRETKRQAHRERQIDTHSERERETETDTIVSGTSL